MRKLRTRNRVICILLFAALFVIMGVKVSSAFIIRHLDGGREEEMSQTSQTGSGIVIFHTGSGNYQSIIPPVVHETISVAPVFIPLFHSEHVLAAIPADPWDILYYPVESWRDSRFELFSWDRFPEILIFDISTKDIQDRLFKRLAFFVEKAGFSGRLAFDEEIADLHGWNAHNYQASDLANFFQTARSTNFPLLPEEWELEAILLRAGVLRRDSASRIIPGNGAVLSLTRESPRNLRSRFMVHEVFHGLFFIDANFREFSHERWEAFPEVGKNLLFAFFEIQAYDTSNKFLLINEFMGHVLQLPVTQASWYFGQHLPNRLLSEDPLNRHYLPAREEVRDGRPFFPDLARIFTDEAEVFSRYVNQRWGLAAGRVWRAR